MKRQFDAACRQYQVKKPVELENLWTNSVKWPLNGVQYDANTQTYEIPVGVASADLHLYTLPEPIPAGTVITVTAFFDSGYYDASRTALYFGGLDSAGSWQAYSGANRAQDLTGAVIAKTFTTTAPVTRFVLVLGNYSVVISEPIRFRIMFVIGGTSASVFKPYGAAANTWTDGLKSGFPSVKLTGKTEQQSYTGKNLFNVLAIETHPEWPQSIVSVDGNGFVVRTPDGYSGNGNTSTGKQLREMAPGLAAGKTYTLSMTSDSAINNFIYLLASGFQWVSGRSRVMTEEDLSSEIYVYGFRQSEGEGTGDCRISNIQIEEGSAVTEYEPYVGGIPSPNPLYPQEVRANNATVRSFGRNLLKLQNQTITTSTGAVFTVADGLVSVEGEPTSTIAVGNIIRGAERTIYPPGTYTLYTGVGTDGSYIPYDENGNAGASTYVWIPKIKILEMTTPFSISNLSLYHVAGGNHLEGPVYPMLLTGEYSLEMLPAGEPYFEGGEASAPPLLCAVDGTCQSSYDTQTGTFVNWWWDKITLNGSEKWISVLAYGDRKGFSAPQALPEKMMQNAYWCNRTAPQSKQKPAAEGAEIWCGLGNTSLLALNFGFYDETLEDKGLANWKAHLADHPLEVWVARNAPEITNIGAQRLTCPTGFGQIVQVAGDIPDCPLEVQYLAHGGYVK